MAYVLDEFLPDVGSGGLDPDYDLVAGGVIDSLGLLKVLAWLEATYDFPTDEVDAGPDDLATVAAIGRLLAARGPGSRPPTRLTHPAGPDRAHRGPIRRRRQRRRRRRTWRTFWDDLAAGRLAAGETVALLASLSARAPAGPTVAAFVESLRERVPAPADRLDGAGQPGRHGGGPPTFNVSTAAAPWWPPPSACPWPSPGRAGSPAVADRSSCWGCGVSPCAVARGGSGHARPPRGRLAGGAVYPPELTDLARSLHPLDLRRLGRFVNSVGPFLAVLPVSVQVVGASGPHRSPAAVPGGTVP